jgi:ligand-binding sensor domain-containing protein
MIRMIGCLMACLCILGCNGDDNGVDDEYPDHTFVWEATGQLQTLADATFLQERPTQYRTTETLPDLDVRSLALIGSDLWAGTATGLARYDSTQDKFTSVPLTAGALPVVDLAEAALLDGRLVVALADRVELHDPSGTNTQLIDIPQVALSVATDGTDIYIGTEVGLGKIETGAFSAITEVPAVQISDIAVDSTYVWLATGTGLIRFDGSQTTTLLPDEQVRAVFSLPAGGVLAGYQTGAPRATGPWNLAWGPCPTTTSLRCSPRAT